MYIQRGLSKQTNPVRQINPDMLVLARRARGLTQGELASVLNVSQPLLSRLEKGGYDIPTDLMGKLVRELHFPESFFFQQGMIVPPGLSVYHRKGDVILDVPQGRDMMKPRGSESRCRIASRRTGLGWIMMLAAYLDGSGTEPSDRVCTVAGYIGVDDQWDLFTAEWKKMLDDFEVSYYHAVDLYHGRHQFEEWSGEKRAQLREAANSILKERPALGFAAFLERSEYDSVFPQKQRAKNSRIHNEFSLCFLGCLDAACRLMPRMYPGLSPSITFVVEKGDSGKRYLEAFFERYRYELLPQYGGLLKEIKFADKKTCVGVQAADFIAHWVQREERKGSSWSSSNHPPPIFARIPLTLEVLESTRDALDKIDMHIPLKKRDGKSVLRRKPR